VYHPSSQLILASGSPRRRELLTRAGYVFDVEPADVDESRLPDELPSDYVLRLAMLKAVTVCSGPKDGRFVLAADTIVVLDNDVLGKPQGRDDAVMMLQRLSGRSHEVLTGVALVRGVARCSAMAKTEVALVALDDQTIETYVATGESFDKAGGYGIQGLASRFVDRINGSYTNVVGLPMVLVEGLMRKLDKSV
jgi:septum formation protein